MNAADLIAEFLLHLGVRHAFGVGGANIEDLFAAVQRRRPRLTAVLCKHEHAAGTAADAYARLSGGLGVVLVTSGGGAMNLVHALAEARASRVPLLALVGEPPIGQQGRGAFQDTSGQGGSIDAGAVFHALTADCVRIHEPRELLAWFERVASLPVSEWTGPRVLLLAKDIQRAEIGTAPRFLAPASARATRVSACCRADLARLLAEQPVVIVAGAEVARRGARAELARLVERLDARVTVAPDARDAFPNDDPRFAGVVGAMGHSSATLALEQARSILLVGTRLPVLERLGLEACWSGKNVACLGREAPFVEGATWLDCGGALAAELLALCEVLPPAPAARGQATTVRLEPEASSLPTQPSSALRTRTVLELLASNWPEAATVLVDAGNAGASAVHYLRAPRAGRWLLAMGMAGMGYSYGAAIGAAFATGRRVFVVSGDGAFFMHGLEVHTAVEHDLPITYLVLDNAAHGMCLVREHLLLGGSSGYNVFRRSCLGAGLATMFPGLAAFDCSSAEQVEQALAKCRGIAGPCFVSARLPEVEVPPFAAFEGARAQGISNVSRN
ncbi:MAG: thiamine pyrophosphate-binding protein [Deltaproteobacteria bacterium]